MGQGILQLLDTVTCDFTSSKLAAMGISADAGIILFFDRTDIILIKEEKPLAFISHSDGKGQESCSLSRSQSQSVQLFLAFLH